MNDNRWRRQKMAKDGWKTRKQSKKIKKTRRSRRESAWQNRQRVIV